MSILTRTLLNLVEQVADNLGARESGTLTASAAALLTAANYPFKTALSTASAAKYAGSEFYTTSGTAPLPSNPVEIVTYSPSAGTFVPSVSYATPPDATSTFDIFKKGIKYADLKAAINKALRERYFETIIPLTLVVDGDMEASGVTTWVATSATSSKVATAGNLIRGTQSLRVANSALNDYATSGTIACTKEDSFYLQARVRAAVGTVNLVAYDITNSADIDSESWDDKGWGGIAFSFSVPATCEEISIRLRGNEATADGYWKDVILLRTGAREIALPDWINDPDQIRGVYTDAGRERYDIDYYVEYNDWDILPDPTSPLNQYRLWLDPAISGPVWLRVAKPYSELSAATDTTSIPREWIEEAATMQMLEDLRNRAPGQDVAGWKIEAAQRKKKLRALDRKYMPQIILRHRFPSHVH